MLQRCPLVVCEEFVPLQEQLVAAARGVGGKGKLSF